MTLAIIIPFYKLIFFESTLKSLAQQTDKRFKVYICDDASPERCNKLLDQFQGDFDYVFHRFENNLGRISLAKHWERCIAFTRNEEWIMILGDDDVLSINFVEEFYSNFEKFGANYDVIRYGVLKIDGEGKSLSGLYINPIIECSKEILFSKKRSSLSEYVFRKKRVTSIGFKNFPLGWNSDVLAVLEFSNFSSIYSINNAFVQVRITVHSISGNNKNNKLKAIASFQFFNYLIFIKSEYFSIEQRKFLLQRLGQCFINDKKNIYYFYKISKIYFKNLFIKDYFKFLINILLSLLNKFNFK